ncbi:MAG: hypothetical protein FGM22_07275 [Burkholderiaceae bacterium]|nr:hypothetical protein [Burkholderiaceae bacterium]
MTKRYRDLAKRHHPDVGGDPGVMAGINAEYQEALRRIAASQARREADKAEARQGKGTGRKTPQAQSQGANFSDASATNSRHGKNGNKVQVATETNRDRGENEPETEAVEAFEDATRQVIRAGARLFGEMAANWIVSKTKGR